ncbi:tRNA glutamyl-Q(34) synthetase GluQRS [Methylobacterium sp. WL12]|nr:tRNA glutamyl-Q(34) synthetase GluQRS [Methylobacterium sp. WL12]
MGRRLQRLPAAGRGPGLLAAGHRLHARPAALPAARRRLTSAGAPRPTFRFAPSPNGRLHLGHAYSALLNADLAARTGGRVLLRIEDIDPARSRPELVDAIMSDLAWLGLRFEAPVRHQSQHMQAYRDARDRLIARGLAYPCFCTRGDVRVASEGSVARDPDGAPLYPGTCRGLPPEAAAARRAARAPHAWRLDMARALATESGTHGYADLALSSPAERGGEGVSHETFRVADPVRWGDAVIARRDVPTSYHLAVVVDDAHQGVTHVVRGCDLEAATDLHVLLQALLGLPTPRYYHHTLILGPDGGKLAKSKASASLADLRARGDTAEAIRATLGFA